MAAFNPIVQLSAQFHVIEYIARYFFLQLRNQGLLREMIHCSNLSLVVAILFLCSVLDAQNDDGFERAKSLHAEASEILRKKTNKAFDKVLALNKIIQSQEVLFTDSVNSAELYVKNEGKLKVLTSFFAPFQNADSTLELTRFFPDSIFQENTNYTEPFKQLIREFLLEKNSAVKHDFLQIGALYLPDTTISYFDRKPIIDFENYWPLEVLEFDSWLQDYEDQIRFYPRSARNDLLYQALQHQLDSLRIEAEVLRFQYARRQLNEKTTTEAEFRSQMEARFQNLKWIGVGSVLILFVLGYQFWKRNHQLLKRNNQLLLDEKKRSEDLLFNMLPAEVVRQLKQEGAVNARKYPAVSVLFSDFKSFTQMAENLTPEELVGELNYCFTTFDRIIEKYHLQKIKTIGDAYMCVGGLYTRGDKHVSRMIAAALEMQQFLKNRKKGMTNGEKIFSEARIGIHTGPVVAGVIGSKRIAFDVWGNTVNVAQQMEQRSEVGQVNISGETFVLIKDKFDCDYRGRVMVKNKREYDMYFVKGPVKG